MVEGGPTIATEFHRRGLVNKYVFHVAPIVSGSDSAPGVFLDDQLMALQEFAITSSTQMDDDLEIVLELQQQKVGAP